ncbi:uncharacterized protein OCT59_027126 [Rhizophagus irregularis]|uniref:uncharacterized protein n=1 Tax=Rhizophagus irregularis TaxID=588596 RepID=UPI00332EB06E|nr:hypothetical protein OCT59_027126 [Rhizophagus irregularis]
MFSQNIFLENWTSGNEKIDDFIQEGQLKTNDNKDNIVLEWIPYNQFNEIKEIDKNDHITVYSAIWKEGLLYRDLCNSYTRKTNEKVILKCLHYSQEFVDPLINEAKKCLTKHKAFQALYGISQNPDMEDYILVQNNYIWFSGNEKIDDFIQKRQLIINAYKDTVLEWIPYNQFDEIKEIDKNDLITVYSAIWKDGPLYRNYGGLWRRSSNKSVALKCLHNSQESIDSLINEAKKCPTKHKAFQALYGISQNPDTKDYILVQNSYIWFSGNEKIDDFIQKRQLEIDYSDIVLEWIPYDQFYEIKETGKNDLIIVYSAIWKDGPLCLEYGWSNYIRDSNKKVALECLYNSQESIDFLINEAKKYPTKHNAFQVLCGISQNPNTRDFILVQNNHIWFSGNEKIDDFIQERQLKIEDYNDIVLEWIPYNQFYKIKETGKNGLITVYSAVWKDGPLYMKDKWSDYKRDLNKKVALICLYNSQESIDFLINETKKYPTKHNTFQVLYGISQSPSTGDYILVQNSYIWFSGNEKIDDFIQERRLKIAHFNNIVLEWIPYDQFYEIKEIGKNGFVTVYSAIWKDGPLCLEYGWSNYMRDSNKKVALKCLYNSQESIDYLINEAKKYPTKHNTFQVLCGISQSPSTGDYILVLIWTSGNEKIDDIIQERRLKLAHFNDIVLEWIPYDQFYEIKEIGKNGLVTVYSAIWKDGPFYWNKQNREYTSDSNKKVVLKCLYNSQESIDYLINEAKKYLTKNNAFQTLYGISQNSNTGNYILVLIWTSGNEKIDDFIQERQLEIEDYNDIVFEWIPYDQFYEIKETGKSGLITVYSAVWKDGPLYKEYSWSNYTRNSNEKVALICLHNSQESINSLINEAKKYPTKHKHIAFQVLYGISQNPYTGDYILVQNIWTSENKKIDDFIQKSQLKRMYCDNIVLEWIPYNQFNEIKEIGKNSLITVHSAIWKDGPLYKEHSWSNCTRDLNKKVSLKCLHNSQGSIDSLINEAKKYPTNYKAFQVLYGISQNPDTGDYILVQKNNVWISGYEKIDDFIQERQLNMEDYNDIVLEWIPYNQFNEIKETGKNSYITVYSAIWKDGPLYREHSWSNCTRDLNKKVSLKCLHNSQGSIDSLINEAKKYPTNYKAFQVLYGISQNPDTGDYILVQKNNVWISGYEKIDDFIQERQLNMEDYNDIVLEWIPYNQFNEFEEKGKNDLITVYSAIWKDGPLYHNFFQGLGRRCSNKEVVLKCLHNSQESIDSLINEAKKYSTNYKAIQALYGISQNPNTEDYILVQNNHIWINGNKKIDDFIQEVQLKPNYNKDDIVLEWIPYDQFYEIKETGKNGLITVYSAIWKDGPLCYKDDWIRGYYTRTSNKKVALKCLCNSQESIDFLINEAKKYPTKHKKFQALYGISQNPYTGDYILVQKNNTWISGYEKIDDFIHERQLIINDYDYDEVVLEWIPYNQFNEIKEKGKNSLITVYSAIWKDGSLYHNGETCGYTRNTNKEVALKCLHNSQESIDSLINEAKKYPTKYKAFQVLYGISQNPDTGDYILVLNCTSGNKKIDNCIQEMRLKINDYNEIVFEWIPYSQFSNIKKIGEGGFSTVYSAKWKDGPLEYNVDRKLYNRNPNRVIALKCLHNSQNITDKFLNEVKEYSINKSSNILNIYGISQNLDTEEYVMVLQYAKDGNFNHWINENCCWDSIPNNRPNIFEIDKLITSFHISYKRDTFIVENEEIEMQFKREGFFIEENEVIEVQFKREDFFMEEIGMQFKKAEEYREANSISTKNYQITTHPQAIYISRLLNSFTKDLPKYDDDDHSQCLDHVI